MCLSKGAVDCLIPCIAFLDPVYPIIGFSGHFHGKLAANTLGLRVVVICVKHARATRTHGAGKQIHLVTFDMGVTAWYPVRFGNSVDDIFLTTRRALQESRQALLGVRGWI